MSIFVVWELEFEEEIQKQLYVIYLYDCESLFFVGLLFFVFFVVYIIFVLFRKIRICVYVFDKIYGYVGGKFVDVDGYKCFFFYLIVF